MRKKSVSYANDAPKTGRQTVYQRVSQREGSPHYVLLYSDGENSGDEESISLRAIPRARSPPRRIEVIQVHVQPEDSLQALSLKYGSTVSELKRINNIHKENEIFAHRTIKVPIKPYSLLTETLNQSGDTNVTGNVGELVTIEDQPTISREEQIINLITTPIVPMLPKSDLNRTILNSLYEPSTSTTGDHAETLEDEENDTLLPPELGGREIQRDITDTLICPGADWGLSWAQLVCCVLLLGLAGPVLYYLVYHPGHAPKPYHTAN